MKPDAAPARAPRLSWDVPGAVALGGALGAVLRYGVSTALPTVPETFPWPTLLVNVVGCLLLGALMVVIEVRAPHKLARPFLGVGVLGGFTTFSTYVTDAMRLIAHGDPGIALAYVAVTLVAALAATLLGTITARRVVGR